jgi:hypothetical protein
VKLALKDTAVMARATGSTPVIRFISKTDAVVDLAVDCIAADRLGRFDLCTPLRRHGFAVVNFHNYLTVQENLSTQSFFIIFFPTDWPANSTHNDGPVSPCVVHGI